MVQISMFGFFSRLFSWLREPQEPKEQIAVTESSAAVCFVLDEPKRSVRFPPRKHREYVTRASQTQANRVSRADHAVETEPVGFPLEAFEREPAEQPKKPEISNVKQNAETPAKYGFQNNGRQTQNVFTFGFNFRQKNEAHKKCGLSSSRVFLDGNKRKQFSRKPTEIEEANEYSTFSEQYPRQYDDEYEERSDQSDHFQNQEFPKIAQSETDQNYYQADDYYGHGNYRFDGKYDEQYSMNDQETESDEPERENKQHEAIGLGNTSKDSENENYEDQTSESNTSNDDEESETEDVEGQENENSEGNRDEDLQDEEKESSEGDESESNENEGSESNGHEDSESNEDEGSESNANRNESSDNSEGSENRDANHESENDETE